MTLTRASLRRAAALVPDGERLALLPLLMQDVVIDPLPPDAALDRLLHYLLDPLGRAIVGVDAAHAAWIAGSPLLRPCGPGAAVPLADDLAAVVVAPMLARADDLPEVLLRWRWSPRADELIAATIAAMEPAAGARALARLRAPGRDEALVHQAALQAGRVLAWAPHLHDGADAQAIVDELLVLLAPTSPRPQLAALVAALGPIARAPTGLGERVRLHGLAQLGAAVERILGRAQPLGFAAELTALAQPTDRAQPDWEHAEFCAHLLGAAAPADSDAFSDWHARCEGVFRELPLFPAFLDGLVQAGAVAPLAQLVAAMTAGDADDRALAADLSTQLPLDEAAPALVALLEDARAEVRVAALRGLTLIGAVEPIAKRLADPEPAVAAAAALALVELGEDARCAERADDPDPLRRAAVAAARGAHDPETLGALIDRLAAVESRDDLAASPLLAAVTASLFTTPAGLHRAAALIGDRPDALSIVALALPRDDAAAPGVLAPPDALAALDHALTAAAADPEAAALGLGLLAGLSCGDATLARRIAAALVATDGGAGPLLDALAALRVRTTEGAAAIAPLLADDQPRGDRLAAVAAAGRILPADHEAWAQLVPMLQLDSDARAAAWAALRDRVRYG